MVSLPASVMDELSKLLEGDIVPCRTPEGATSIEVVYEAETFWLNQKTLAEFFGIDVRTIRHHLEEMLASGELDEAATVQGSGEFDAKGIARSRRSRPS